MSHAADRTSASEVEAGIRALLPGAVMRRRPSGSAEPSESGRESIVFRIGPAVSVILRAGDTAWEVVPEASDDGAAAGAPFALAAVPEAPAPLIAGEFAAFLESWARRALPGTFDTGLLTALGVAAPGGGVAAMAPTQGVPRVPGVILPPFAASADPTAAVATFASQAVAPPRTSFTRRAIVIASIVVGSLLVLGGGAAGVAAVIGASVKVGQEPDGSDGATGSTAATQLAVGDCFDIADASMSSDKVEPVSCSKQHDSELFAIATIPETTDTSGRLQYDLADIACFPHFSDYVGTEYNDSDDDYDVLTPSQNAWDDGDRRAYCYLEFDGDRTGSAHDSGE